MAVIAYHSLEDRIVKVTFRRMSGECVCPPGMPVCGCGRSRELRVVGRATRAGREEVQRNRRARSAILRVVERIDEQPSKATGALAGGWDEG